MSEIIVEKKSIFTGSKEYLEKSFLEELNYKIWTTKGARFKADRRLTTISKMSNISFSILSAYLIIAGLLAVYNIENNDGNLGLINYYITALSIIQLVVAQFENNQDYKMKAKNFHDCSLELSKLYNKLRTFKTLNSQASEYTTLNFCQQLADEYQEILCRYENHEDIDYESFKITQLNYFKELTTKDVKKIKKNYWWKCYGWYSLIIALPPIVILVITIL
ncbi:SLATT domain-containing protein [Flavobacterium sp. LS1R10]|uniref:SLATT domain-containing protein n=1 Tax=Flavobacterium sp. LS1R10 TaxID=2497482 RepID=UPI000F82C14B|nr:SLATT domain-containing protein [Flavobacterium sp. LS1R10]RTY75145.1 SLATT domain-containing protein [Flavobacterium sp. LS1R10]